MFCYPVPQVFRFPCSDSPKYHPSFLTVTRKTVLTDPKAAVAKGAQQVFEQLLTAKPQAESATKEIHRKVTSESMKFGKNPCSISNILFFGGLV
jgi:hypothetical protein